MYKFSMSKYYLQARELNYTSCISQTFAQHSTPISRTCRLKLVHTVEQLCSSASRLLSTNDSAICHHPRCCFSLERCRQQFATLAFSGSDEYVRTAAIAQPLTQLLHTLSIQTDRQTTRDSIACSLSLDNDKMGNQVTGTDANKVGLLAQNMGRSNKHGGEAMLCIIIDGVLKSSCTPKYECTL
jgi:hypothetical protein